MTADSYSWGNEPNAFADLYNQWLASQTEPTPFMDTFYSATGLNPNMIGTYITRMFSGKRAGQLAGEYEERGLSDVNRIAKQMFNRERLRSAVTGGRGSSAEAALKAKGAESLATARSGVRGQAAEYEQTLRDKMFSRGANVLGAWEGATRGDWQQAQQYTESLLGGLSPLLTATGLNQQFLEYLMNYFQNQDFFETEHPVEEE